VHLDFETRFIYAKQIKTWNSLLNYIHMKKQQLLENFAIIKSQVNAKSLARNTMNERERSARADANACFLFFLPMYYH
jgi:hypothetical protein